MNTALRKKLASPFIALSKQAIRAYYSAITSFRDPYQFIFILSHMRSGSSLLTHILVSNPEITGYGETHVAYRTPRDLSMAIGKSLLMSGQFPFPSNERYLVDKILHNRLLSEENIGLISNPQSKIIFLVREPLGALKSLRAHQNIGEQSAVDYYINRVNTLTRLCRSLPSQQQCILITHDHILKSAEQTLPLLTQFLDLKKPLLKEYKILKTTGRRGIGDSSNNIKKGKILSSISNHKEIIISQEGLTNSAQAFTNCIETLNERCASLSNEDLIIR